MGATEVVFFLGCALVIIGILGGGMEVKEIKIPPLSTLPRLLSGVFGVILLTLAYSGIPNPGPATPGPVAPTANTSFAAPAPTSSERFVTIMDKLGDGQEFERIEVFIAGQRVGEVVVDQRRTTNSIRIPVSDRTELYTLEGSEATRRPQGVVTRSIKGDGRIDLRMPKTFNLVVKSETPGSIVAELAEVQ